MSGPEDLDARIRAALHAVGDAVERDAVERDALERDALDPGVDPRPGPTSVEWLEPRHAEDRGAHAGRWVGASLVAACLIAGGSVAVVIATSHSDQVGPGGPHRNNLPTYYSPSAAASSAAASSAATSAAAPAASPTGCTTTTVDTATSVATSAATSAASAATSAVSATASCGPRVRTSTAASR